MFAKSSVMYIIPKIYIFVNLIYEKIRSTCLQNTAVLLIFDVSTLGEQSKKKIR